MKPRLFIGSSREGSEVARSIHANLDRNAECSVWDQGVFGLNDVTLQTLLERVGTSDFGVFVCSADDTAIIREASNPVVRDNVLFELGMFMGYLGPQRTFFLVPEDASDLHLPSDLKGITYGTYDTNRRDGALRQATGPFCTEVKTKIESEGFRRKEQHSRLDNLAVTYACCEWIPDTGPYTDVPRWQQKNQIMNKMIEECGREPPNKRALAAQSLEALSDQKLDYMASKIRVFAAIAAKPELSDIDLILAIPLINLPDGNARIRALYAATDVANKFQTKPAIHRLTELLSIPSKEHYVKDAQTRIRESLARAKASK